MAELMTDGDLLALAPWVVFGVLLAAVCARLLFARRPAGRPLSARLSRCCSRFLGIWTRYQRRLRARRSTAASRISSRHRSLPGG